MSQGENEIFNMSSQRHKRGSLLLSSRCMTNHVKTCSFLHAHCTETMKVVENLFQRELMMKNIFNHIMYVTICRFLPSMYMFWVYSHCKTLKQSACADPKGGGTGGPPPPLKNHKNIGFLSNTGLDPLKITKLQSQHSMAFSWRADDCLLIVVLILPPLIN